MANLVMLTLLGVAFYGFSTGNALMCVVCSAPCPSNLPNATNCINGEEFCMKQLIGVPGDEIYKRDCESKAPPAGKTKICKAIGSKEDCIFYCKTDGCNAAFSSQYFCGHWIVLTGSLLATVTFTNGIF